MMGRVPLVLAICLLSLWKGCVAGPPQVDLLDGPQLVDEPTADGNSTQRACTLDELLPLTPSKGKSEEWVNGNAAEDSYNCSCAAMKAR